MVLELINDMEKSLENGCCYAVLMIALALPDICGKAEYPDKKITERYIQWYSEYIGKYDQDSDEDMQLPYLSGELVNSLRNSIFHQGTPDIDLKKDTNNVKKIGKFVLQVTDTHGIYGDVCFENLFSDDCTYIADIGRLCFIIGKSTRSYYQNNIEKFSFVNCDVWDLRN